MKKRILIVSSEFPPGPGGIGDHAYNLAQSLVSMGNTVVVVSEWREEFGSYEDIAATVLRVRLSRSSSVFRNISFLWNTIIEYFFWRPDLLIVTGSKAILTTFFVSKLRQVVILHGHEVMMGSWARLSLIRWRIRGSALGICVSEFSKRNTQLFVSSKLVVIPNGYNDRKFGGLKHRVNPKDEFMPRLITVGRVSSRKGQINVIRKLGKIASTFPRIQYHVVGILSDSSIVDFVEGLGLRERVKFWGVLPDSEMRSLLATCDIFVMLSENLPNGDVEGFGIAILEANALGLPAIGSKGCGIEQAICSGFSGILVHPDDEEEFLRAIQKIVTSYDSFTSNALEWARRHRWTEVSKLYEAELSRL